MAEQQVALHRAHPWLAAVSALPSPLGPHVLDHVEWVIGVLAPVGAPAGAVMEAVALTNGAAALFASAGSSAGPGLFRDLEPGRQPGLAALLAGAAPSPPSDDLFRRVLTGILTAVLDTPARR